MTINIKSPHEYLNATVVGTPTIVDGVVSGFSASNYLTLPETFNPESNTWEIVYKINRNADSGVYESILGNSKSDYSNGIHIFKGSSGKINLECCTLGASSWNICDIAGTTITEINKDYWIKAEFTGSAYNLYLSEDGVIYNLEASVNSTTSLGATLVQTIGISLNATASYFRGSIDLNESYIKINGEYWWKGMELDQYKEIKRLYCSDSSLIKQVYKTDKTKYFKYLTEDTTWTQPVNPTGITATSGWGSVASAFDGNASTYATCGTATDYIEWDLGTKVYLSGITATGNHASEVARACNIIVKSVNEDGTETTLGTTTGATNTTTYTIKTSFTEVLVSKLRFYLTNGDGGKAPTTSYKTRIREINLTASKQQVKIPTGVKEVPFTFPELTSEGSIGGDEFGVQALDDRVTGLMNMFQPLVDGKPANGVYTEVPIDGIAEVVLFKIYSPIPFKGFEIKIYKGLDENGVASGDKFWYGAIYCFAPSNDDVNYGFYSPSMDRQMSYLALYFVEETDEYLLLRSKQPLINEAGTNKFWKFSTMGQNIGIVKVGKIEITGLLEEPLTSSDDYDYKELIPTLVYEDNGTVFEQSTAGTYTFVVTETAPYEITLVGGGGGGAFNSSGNAGSAAAGNSGSGLVVNANLKAGTYVLNVGAGGAWSGWLDANTWGGNGSQSSISKDGVVLATAGGGTGNHAWWRSGSAHNSTVGAAPTYTDALGVTDIILNTQGNWGGLAATSSGGASVVSGTTWGKGGDTRDRNAADNGNAGCIRIVRLEK